jgi:hypothetical protein
MKISLLILLLTMSILSGCAGSKISSSASNSVKTINPVNEIAMAPDSGLVGDSLAIELSNRGFKVIDSHAFELILSKLNIDTLEMTRPGGLEKIKSKGVDAVLYVKGVAGHDNEPQSVSVRITSTTNGRLITGLVWQNAFGGRAGSIADRVMRKGMTEAVKEIADEVEKSLKPAN